jgi:hypothetical protein
MFMIFHSIIYFNSHDIKSTLKLYMTHSDNYIHDSFSSDWKPSPPNFALYSHHIMEKATRTLMFG